MADEIDRSALFERLARGHAERIVVVTPNRRLAQALEAEFDRRQLARGLKSWEAPDILPFGAFVQRLYEDGLYSDLSAELPMLLTPAQEEEIWRQVVTVESAAADCRDAWNLANAWRIRPGAGALRGRSGRLTPRSGAPGPPGSTQGRPSAMLGRAHLAGPVRGSGWPAWTCAACSSRSTPPCATPRSSTR